MELRPPPPPTLRFGAAIVLSAFLLFQVQPMAARAILPWFGGAASVWITCLLFFQAGLFAGYLYAHGLVRLLSPGRQAIVHAALLAASLALLPVNPRAGWRPAGQEDPSLRILALLSLSVGLPYVLLSATSPLLQAWYARSNPRGLPWRLFALSNLGSLAALLSYPLAVEPFAGVTRQMHAWSAAYAACAVLIGAVAWSSARTGRVAIPAVEAPRPSRLDHLHWVLLPACASIVLVSVSSHLTQDVAAIPFLWVALLALYLVTFILCFEGRGWYRRGTFVPLLFLAAGAMTFLLGPETEAVTLWLAIPVFAAGLFVCCMVCHGELARLRPHPSHLTSFYLCVAAGGALGGILAAAVAPRVFSGLWEMHLGMAGSVALLLVAVWRRRPARLGPALFRPVWGAAAALGLLVALGLAVQAKRLRDSTVVMARDFYGGFRVRDRRMPGAAGDVRILLHGVINHGEQFLDPARRREPTSYYAPYSGAALALAREPRRAGLRVGVVGLGTGTLATFGRAGDEFRFYEISPLVAELARTRFTFLSDSAARCDIVLGDARRSLEREPGRTFDVLVIDAFSGDAIPTHLVTREAFAEYRRHLEPGGTLLFNVTNRYMDIAPVVARGGAGEGLRAVFVHAFPDDSHLWRGSDWVLLGERRPDVPYLKGLNSVRELAADPSRPAWTDDHSDLFGALRW